MSEWEEVNLRDICCEEGIQTGPFGSQLHRSDYSDEGIPVVMPVNLVNGNISTDNIARVSDEHVTRLNRYRLDTNDIVYARRGDIGRCAQIREEQKGWLCGTGCIKLTGNNAKVDKKFLFFSLQNPSIVSWVRNHAVGATLPNLNTEILASIPISIPVEISIQKRIANILQTYDKLIENNRKQIKLLEEAAQRLYKEWFVDLKFPGYETTPIIDDLPEGWETQNFLSLVDVIRGCSYTSENLAANSETYLLNLNNIKAFGGWNDSAEKPYEGTCKPEQIAHTGDILMAVTDMTKERRLVGHVGRVPRSADGGIFSMDLIKLVPHSMNREYLYTLLRFSGISETISMLANGTNVLHLKPNELSRINLVAPKLDIQKRYFCIITPLLTKIDALYELNNAAQEARDRLLPKLMSGEIEVE